MRESKGIQKLRNRIKEGKIIILKTDKSGKLVVAKKDDYLKMAKNKIAKDRKLDRGEIKNIEEE